MKKHCARHTHGARAGQDAVALTNKAFDSAVARTSCNDNEAAVELSVEFAGCTEQHLLW